MLANAGERYWLYGAHYDTLNKPQTNSSQPPLIQHKFKKKEKDWLLSFNDLFAFYKILKHPPRGSGTSVFPWVSPQVWYLLFRAFEFLSLTLIKLSLRSRHGSHSTSDELHRAQGLQAQVMRHRYATSPAYRVSFEIQKHKNVSIQHRLMTYYDMLAQLLMLLTSRSLREISKTFWCHSVAKVLKASFCVGSLKMNLNSEINSGINDIKLYLVNLRLFYSPILVN